MRRRQELHRLSIKFWKRETSLLLTWAAMEKQLVGSGVETGPPGQRFARSGLVGLFDPDPPRGYVAQIHEARARGWERVDPRDSALREVVHLVLGPGASWVASSPPVAAPWSTSTASSCRASPRSSIASAPRATSA